MNTEIKIFNNSQFGEIRTATDENGEPVFCLADLCKALNIKNPTDVKKRMDTDDLDSIEAIDSLGRSIFFLF